MVGKKSLKTGKVNLTEIIRLKNPDEMGDLYYATRYSVTVPERLTRTPKYVYIYIYINIYINIGVNLTLPTIDFRTVTL